MSTKNRHLSKHILATLICLSAVAFWLLPSFAFAAIGDLLPTAGRQPGGFIPCGQDANGDKQVSDVEQCGFQDFITGINTIANYLIFIGTVLASVSFAYAGFLYLTSAGSTEKISHAHGIFLKVAIGFVIMLLAWLIVKTIETAFIDSSTGFKLFL